MIFFFRNRILSVFPAIEGIIYVIRTQKNSWIHLFASTLAIFLSIYLGLSRVEFSLIIFAIGLVWVTEFINTAIECTIDLHGTEINWISKSVKDTSAAAVLISAITALLIGIFIFYNPLLTKLNGLSF